MMDRHLAFALFERPVVLDLATVVDVLRKRHPGIEIDLSGAAPGTASPVIRCAGVNVMLMVMPMPVPRESWDLPGRRAVATWPTALEVLGRHGAHVVVSTVGQARTPEQQLQAARAVTAVTGGLIAAVPAAAVLWDGLVAHSAERWEQLSRESFAGYPRIPFPLWVSIHPFRDGQIVGAITFGLRPFGGREIELEGAGADPKQVVRQVAGLIVYVLEHGAVLRDGDTLGAGESDRIRIQHLVSRRVQGLPVLQATVPAAA
ncbi:DUF4261 domain-containing protein [Bradyrhizobium sacchari]|uniref:Uncharacterized protein DUF4261 n=1 Tax=Bradyrhizobium sacchari TaxID=1399419 RepID=A0A560IIM1_9BRAD|nr:DUF4261 domain-containing protein [Bradyrhizobium sacchari]TWB58867.1 uncharacterized protein DUF4261 [Bradyrhizobium sacchari]TWB72773.1 uncharacterized protein DUF4261 [Bradyrhizobium sacchari]